MTVAIFCSSFFSNTLEATKRKTKSVNSTPKVRVILNKITLLLLYDGDDIQKVFENMKYIMILALVVELITVRKIQKFVSELIKC